MNQALSIIGLVCVAWVAILVLGAQPERRYQNDACQYNMIYKADPKVPIGLLTLGGSRVRVSTHARDLQAIIDERNPEALTMHNLAHSIFVLEKEYVLLRDLLERRNVKSALIMIERPNGGLDRNIADFFTIARLSDIPMAFNALWPENPKYAILSVRDIIWEHLRFYARTDGKKHKEQTDFDCDKLDYRLNIPALADAEAKFEMSKLETLDWDVLNNSGTVFLRWMKAYKTLADEAGVQIIFIVITATSEPLPSYNLEATFFSKTGMHLITMDREIHEKLSMIGKRDSSHINQQGRRIFLPWLYQRILEKCTRQDGCL